MAADRLPITMRSVPCIPKVDKSELEKAAERFADNGGLEDPAQWPSSGELGSSPESVSDSVRDAAAKVEGAGDTLKSTESSDGELRDGEWSDGELRDDDSIPVSGRHLTAAVAAVSSLGVDKDEKNIVATLQNAMIALGSGIITQGEFDTVYKHLLPDHSIDYTRQ